MDTDITKEFLSRVMDTAALVGWISFQVQILRGKIKGNPVHDVVQLIFVVAMLGYFLS